MASCSLQTIDLREAGSRFSGLIPRFRGSTNLGLRSIGDCSKLRYRAYGMSTNQVGGGKTGLVRGKLKLFQEFCVQTWAPYSNIPCTSICAEFTVTKLPTICSSKSFKTVHQIVVKIAASKLEPREQSARRRRWIRSETSHNLRNCRPISPKVGGKSPNADSISDCQIGPNFRAPFLGRQACPAKPPPGNS